MHNFMQVFWMPFADFFRKHNFYDALQWHMHFFRAELDAKLMSYGGSVAKHFRTFHPTSKNHLCNGCG